MDQGKKRILSATLLILTAFCISVCHLAFNRVKLKETAATFSPRPLPEQPVIVIDPGHGGMDGGAVGVDGLVEKDINLQISLTLRDLFLANGFPVVMTRETDVSIHDPGLTTIRSQKVSDMKKRLAIMEAQENGIFLSVHQNLFAQPKYSGAQIFYSPNHPMSSVLAKALQNTMREKLAPENSRVEKKAGKELYLLYHAKIPAVLVECGFLSNPEEASKLNTEEYRGKVAFAVFSGVLESYKAQDAGSEASQP